MQGSVWETCAASHRTLSKQKTVIRTAVETVKQAVSGSKLSRRPEPAALGERRGSQSETLVEIPANLAKIALHSRMLTAVTDYVMRVTRTILNWIPRPWLACNRRSVAGGIAVGLFVSWLPLPLQTLLAGAFAAVLRVHVPSSMVMVWFTNPLTVVPLLYSAWVVGSTILPPSPELQNLTLSWSSVMMATTHGWPVLFTGCMACATLTSAIAYFAVLLALKDKEPGDDESTSCLNCPS